MVKRGRPTIRPAVASATTILVRIATLWFAVVIGIVALAAYRATAPPGGRPVLAALVPCAPMIEVGSRFPDATLRESLEYGDACPMPPQPVQVAEALAGKRVVVFGLPGAFTWTCSVKHLPGYRDNYEALKAKGIDEVWCVAVNDGAVMAAWGRDQNATGKVRMLGDGEAELTRKLGLDVQIPGLGTRMARCSMLVEDGVLRGLWLEEPRQFGVSSAEAMLERL